MKLLNNKTNIKSAIPANIKIAAKLYLLVVGIYTLFRLGLLLVCFQKLGNATFAEVLKAFAIGLRFDCVVAGFALALPILLVSIATFVGKNNRWFAKTVAIVTSIILIPTFAVCAADIPYFNQFFIHFNSAAFDGLEGNMTLVMKMIFEEVRFWIMIVPAIIVAIVFYIATHRILTTTKPWTKGQYIAKTISTIVLLFLMFAGMRGNLNFKTRPLHTGMAYFGNNQMLNQLGLNPMFIFLNSFSSTDDDKIALMPNAEAIISMQKRLDITTPDPTYPIARQISFDENQRKLNVVLILMESMSAYNLSYHGNTKMLTPFLDSILNHSLYFENCYTMGNRTCSGMYSTTTAYPTLFDKQPMYGTTIRLFNSLPYELKKHGYSTTFFLTHDKNFDNSNGFLLANGYDRVYSQEDYPAHEIKNTWGVCDEFLFDFALNKIDTLASSNNPFFATILTISNHPPYYFDPDFEFRNKDDNEKIVEYADAMLRKFFEQASKTSWFDSTVFVLIGDHGTSQDATYPLPLSYFHTPLMFYAPNIIAAEINQNMANQIDVFPSIMGILNLPYTANHFGIDLRRQKRPFACIMNVSGYAILDNEWMMLYKKNTGEKLLYKYRDKDITNHISTQPERANNMDLYGKQMWQTTQYLLDKRATRTE